MKERYFPTNGSRKWSFATKGSAKDNIFGVELFRASTVAIIRHIKVRATANPFDLKGSNTSPVIALRNVLLDGPVPLHGAEEGLEPYAGWPARTVLRGRRHSNVPLLPDTTARPALPATPWSTTELNYDPPQYLI